MNFGEKEHFLTCPYCGESISILVEPLEEDQQYVEDCEVCCRPVQVKIFKGPDDKIEVKFERDS